MRQLQEYLKSLVVGDTVTRNMCGVKMPLKISEITDELIICGPWSFSKKTGAEIDEELGWNETRSGGSISLPTELAQLN